VSKSDEIYIEHILAAIAQIKRYTSDGETAFLQSELIQDAVIRRLEIVGEAVKNLSEDLRARYPGIPWQAIAANRDRLIHGYFVVDPKRVWRTVVESVPALERDIAGIAKAIGVDVSAANNADHPGKNG
jgi:uncharacterized protein with HEPN domain